MPSSLDSTSLSPDERFRELARLLATGVLRLARPVIAPETAPDPAAKTLPESSANHLAVLPTKSVTVHAG